jgi:hypothetical protein
MTRTLEWDHGNGVKERITVEYDPKEPFAVITRQEKTISDRKFKTVESVAIPAPLVPRVCFALGATEWEQ